MDLDLTPSELRLMLKLAEANDQGNLGRRIGSIRTRTTLMNKLYNAVDALSGDELEQSDREQEDDNAKQS